MSAQRNGVRRYSSEFLECRYKRHAWKILGVVPVDGEIVTTLRCRDCDTTRRHFMSTGGEVRANRYDYPDGYKVKGGLEPIKVRREIIRRLAQR